MFCSWQCCTNQAGCVFFLRHHAIYVAQITIDLQSSPHNGSNFHDAAAAAERSLDFMFGWEAVNSTTHWRWSQRQWDSNNGLHRFMDPLTRGDWLSIKHENHRQESFAGVHKEPVRDVESIIRFHWDQLLHYSLPFRRRQTKLLQRSACRSNRYFWLQIFPQ